MMTAADRTTPLPDIVDLVSNDDGEDFIHSPAATPHQSRGLGSQPTGDEEPISAEERRDQATDGLALDGRVRIWDLDELPGVRVGRGVCEPVSMKSTPSVNHNEAVEMLVIDGEEVWIPADIGDPFAAVTQQSRPPRQVGNALDHQSILALDSHNFTAGGCLRSVLGIFPDVSRAHVLKLYEELCLGENDVPRPSLLEEIVERLVSAESYPKQEKGKKTKRKREEDQDDNQDSKRWEGPDRKALPANLNGTISAMLKADFPGAPLTTIRAELGKHKHLYQAHVALATIQDTDAGKRWRGRAPVNVATADNIALNSGSVVLVAELDAARKRVHHLRLERTAGEIKQKVEEQNLERAIQAGETTECSVCYDDKPMNRQIHCNGDTAHFTCFNCATSYIKSEVGESRCRVLCTAGCGAGFAHAQLHLLEDKQLLEKFEQLQQEKDIRDAALDDLEECPFCDYKAILPPVDEDFEFRCANPECERISCRRCKAVSHTPISCEEYAKDKKLNSRHKIEEAMTAALVRQCNKCKKQFIKDLGCNKMACSSCGNLQCYVCSMSVTDYSHFDHRGDATVEGKCPLYDNVEKRHEREVKEAEAAARIQVMQENPEMTKQDLRMEMPGAVSKGAQRRRGGIPGIPPRVPALGDEDEDEDDDDDGDGDNDVPFVVRSGGYPPRRAGYVGRHPAFMPPFRYPGRCITIPPQVYPGGHLRGHLRGHPGDDPGGNLGGYSGGYPGGRPVRYPCSCPGINPGIYPRAYPGDYPGGHKTQQEQLLRPHTAVAGPSQPQPTPIHGAQWPNGYPVPVPVPPAHPAPRAPPPVGFETGNVMDEQGGRPGGPPGWFNGFAGYHAPVPIHPFEGFAQLGQAGEPEQFSNHPLGLGVPPELGAPPYNRAAYGILRNQQW